MKSNIDILDADLESDEDQSNPRPFLKWAGGKTQLLPEILARVPQSYGTYFEPFLGGGAVFFSLQPQVAVLAEVNANLINTYQVVRDNLELLIEDLKKHVYKSDYYYKVRNADRSSDFWIWNQIERASRFIYLNKTCFNGLYRVNSRGEFNVPIGRYQNPKILDQENLTACSLVLKNAKINTASFEAVLELANSGDFVYFDPPYVPLSATSNFTSYTESGFGLERQEQLRDCFRALDQKGVKVLLSNSQSDLILELYKEFKIETVDASRAINSKAERRGKIKEVLISNYL